ncbi:GTPase ObgE [Lactobacillus sp. CBA3605]|uniref:GTPase ObgE n=1 Tax=Lactobacillus sp. CBA3605 TaxID=2099788 RepID=UPI000CFB209F|nr:GTPase ObgE [Lactobacillus sp. CBA3605]AVK60582.1 GTPase ObgE [Lactobacillus sp. CBA3605]
MFVDQVKVDVKAGNGGNGMVAFRREKFVPNGGPAGGDGGRGGSIVLVADEGLRTLMDFRYTRKFKAESGGNGMIKQMTGRSAKNRIIKVPLGTTVTDAESGDLIGDITEKDQKLVIAKGGRGGRGNIHFASPKNPAPEISENGEPGAELTIRLELKVLADVGLVGFPSVGKSTLLSVVTSAKPKIAAYHFTTLVPNLGMVRLDDGRDFVMADLPGLIEGAANGVGLGIQFLRHIERTRVILHLIDMSGVEENDPFEDYLKINHELTSYDPELLKRPQIVVATKMDMPDSAEHLAEFEAKLKKDDTLATVPAIYPISSITQQGIKALLAQTADLLDTTPQFPIKGIDDVAHREYQAEPSQEFTVDNPEPGLFVLSGEKLERLFKMTNLDREESLMRFARQIRGMGIDDALRAAGAKNDDTIQILDYQFQFMD